MIEVLVAGAPVRVGALWVELGSTFSSEFAPYKIHVPERFVRRIFVTPGESNFSVPIAQQVQTRIEEFGGFMLSGFLAEMRLVNGDKQGPFEWVINSVAEIAHDADGLTLAGRVARFIPQRPHPTG